MHKVNYKELKHGFLKSRDSWSERLLIHPVSVPLSYLLLRISQSRKMPYVITVSTFLLSLAGAVLISIDYYQAGAILLLCAFILDNVDGTLSRFIYGKDPILRGTLDFTLDNIAWFPIVLSFFYVLLKNGSSVEQILLFIFVSLLGVLSSQTSTNFRLCHNFGYNSDVLVADNKTSINELPILGKWANVYIKLNKLSASYRTFSYPTVPDIHVIVYIMVPFVRFKFFNLLISIGIGIVILNIIVQLIANYTLIRICEE